MPGCEELQRWEAPLRRLFGAGPKAHLPDRALIAHKPDRTLPEPSGDVPGRKTRAATVSVSSKRLLAEGEADMPPTGVAHSRPPSAPLNA